MGSPFDTTKHEEKIRVVVNNDEGQDPFAKLTKYLKNQADKHDKAVNGIKDKLKIITEEINGNAATLNGIAATVNTNATAIKALQEDCNRIQKIMLACADAARDE